MLHLGTPIQLHHWVNDGKYSIHGAFGLFKVFSLGGLTSGGVASSSHEMIESCMSTTPYSNNNGNLS